MTARWKAISPSQFPWEQDALDCIQRAMPNREPFRAYSNFEFIADDGSINEVDVLIVSRYSIFLVEIKSRPGEVGGDAHTWVWRDGSREYFDDNPLLLTNRKAKKLASLLRKQMTIQKRRTPYIQSLVFLSDPAQRCKLTGPARENVHLRADIASKLFGETPPVASAQPIDRELATSVNRALETMGIRPPQQSRRVGDYQLEQVLAETDYHQDWLAKHVSLTNLKRRVAAHSRYGTAALREKVKAFAIALNEMNLLDARDRLGSLMAHRGPVLSDRSVSRCKMALRLVSWHSQSSDKRQPSLPALSEQYRNEIAWVDWAQTVLLEGDDTVELGNAYAQLRESTRVRRELFDRRFAESLVTDKPDGITLMRIEDALDKCVAPVAAAGRTLLIVVDGMSISVFLELHHSLREHGWSQCERNAGACSTLLAMLPSTTEASRTSLLCGAACSGSASTERPAFTAFPSLVAPSVAGKPPVIFHKRDLLDSSGVTLSDDLRGALSDARQRVVAVVINAVDDHLMKSDQLRLRWDLAQFRGLDALLAEARSSDRAVIFTSDHGHILDQDTEMRGSSPNARWREPNLESYSGEIKLSGARVKAACGMDEVVLAWDTRLRYATKRNGYHGGCSPAEALVPIATYKYGTMVGDEWSVCDEAPPAWWEA